MGKKIIAAPRLSKYKEHVNDHQLQIVDTFTKAKYILPLNNFDELSQLFDCATFSLNKLKFIKNSSHKNKNHNK